MIEIKDMNFAYPNGAGRLKDVNLRLEKGQILTVLGKNGAGKSTMLGLISGSLKPISGKISLNGEDVYKMSSKERAKIMSYVAQNNDPATLGRWLGAALIIGGVAVLKLSA